MGVARVSCVGGPGCDGGCDGGKIDALVTERFSVQRVKEFALSQPRGTAGKEGKGSEGEAWCDVRIEVVDAADDRGGEGRIKLVALTTRWHD